MRVMGIDPGIGRTGVAVVEGQGSALELIHAGCLESPPGMPDADRLLIIDSALRDLVQRLSPEVAAVETLYFSSNRTTAMQVAQARGVILCVAAAAGLPVVEYAPNQVKETVTGYGAARKPQVIRMVRHHLNDAEITGPDDVYDACAVAICHHHRRGLHSAMSLRGQRVTPSLQRAIAAAQARLVEERP